MSQRMPNVGVRVRLPEAPLFRRFAVLLAAAALACGSDPGPVEPGAPPPPPARPPDGVQLAVIEIPLLPSPYYRFEYDSAGRVSAASFASDLRTYEVQYSNNRISRMVSTRFSREELVYSYDASGKVSAVTYNDTFGVDYVRVHLSYAGERLHKLERERRIGDIFLADKRMTFVYDSPGNLTELTDERLAFPGQTEATFIDRFEQYDGKINVDGFSLIHNEFFDHLVLLPGVHLQVGNPSGVTRSGSGINYHIDYTYTYDSANRPITKHGEGILLAGTGAGDRFETNATFSYR